MHWLHDGLMGRGKHQLDDVLLHQGLQVLPSQLGVVSTGPNLHLNRYSQHHKLWFLVYGFLQSIYYQSTELLYASLRSSPISASGLWAGIYSLPCVS